MIAAEQERIAQIEAGGTNEAQLLKDIDSVTGLKLLELLKVLGLKK